MFSPSQYRKTQQNCSMTSVASPPLSSFSSYIGNDINKKNQKDSSPINSFSSSFPTLYTTTPASSINSDVIISPDEKSIYSLSSTISSSSSSPPSDISFSSSDGFCSCCPPSTNASSSACACVSPPCTCNFSVFSSSLPTSASSSPLPIINEKTVLKFLALYNKINKDEKFSMQIRTLWKGGDIQMLYNDEIATEVENEYNVLKKYVHYKTQDVCSTNSLFCELHSLHSNRQKKKELIRVFVDGVFDLAHSGHFNAFRQAKALGDVLVVGVNSDEEVYRAKGGYPIYNENERAEIIRGCKWVDEVIVGTPYSVNLNLLNMLNCNFVAHGDDMPITHDGHDCYSQPRLAGRLRIFKRTEGISTTTLVSRLLLATRNIENLVEVESPKSIHRFIEESLSFSNKNKNNNSNINDDNISSSSSNKILCKNLKCNNKYIKNSEEEKSNNNNSKLSECDKCNINYYFEDEEKSLSVCRQTLMSTKRLMQFIDNSKQAPKVNDKIVYVDGSFDVLHVGHMRILQKAKELGDYLIVGIHDDGTVHRVKGAGFPVMNLLERALNVLALRVVDEVIIGAPWIITEYLIKSFYIDIVVRGTRIDAMETPRSQNGQKSKKNLLSDLSFSSKIDEEKKKEEKNEEEQMDDPYEVPKRLGIYREVESSSSLTTSEIIRRIVDNRITLLSSIQTRKKKEAKHWKDKEKGLSHLVKEL